MEFGPILSLLGAALSIFFFYMNYSLSRRTANRSIYVEGQKFLIDICKHLTADPMLWCVYDDHALARSSGGETADAKFEAKLTAFAHLHVNMFEIILNEAPNPKPDDPQNQSNVWVNYFRDTLSRSRRIRAVLEEPESGQIWSPVLLDHYRQWTKKQK